MYDLIQNLQVFLMGLVIWCFCVNNTNIQCYRYQIAEAILRRAEPVSPDLSSTEPVSIVGQSIFILSNISS